MIKEETSMAKTKALYTLTVQKGTMQPLKMYFTEIAPFFESVRKMEAAGFAVSYDPSGYTIYNDAALALETAELFAR